jgi:hypothetical protein
MICVQGTPRDDTAGGVVLVQRMRQLLAHGAQAGAQLVRLQHQRIPLLHWHAPCETDKCGQRGKVWTRAPTAGLHALVSVLRALAVRSWRAAGLYS